MLAKTTPMGFVRPALNGGSTNLREAIAVQIIEENPLDAEQIAMFEMFERENWSHENRRAFLADRAQRS